MTMLVCPECCCGEFEIGLWRGDHCCICKNCKLVCGIEMLVTKDEFIPPVYKPHPMVKRDFVIHDHRNV